MYFLKNLTGKNRKVIPFLLFGMQLLFAFTSLFVREYFQLDMPVLKYDLEESVKNNIVFIILFFAIVIPFIEEYIFRICLTLNVKHLIWSFLVGIIYLFIIGGNYLVLDIAYIFFFYFLFYFWRLENPFLRSM